MQIVTVPQPEILQTSGFEGSRGDYNNGGEQTWE